MNTVRRAVAMSLLIASSTASIGCDHTVLLTARNPPEESNTNGNGNQNSHNPPPPNTDHDAPEAAIVFPFAHALVDAGEGAVRGTASDASAIAAVEVNGVAATSSDGFATWTARVPLSPGLNSLLVSAGDVHHNVSPQADTGQITRGPAPRELSAVAFDAANNRVLVLDELRRLLFAVDAATSTAAILSDFDTPNDAVPLLRPTAVAVDATRGRCLVADARHDGVIAVDLHDGARTLLVSDAALLSNPVAIALDQAHDRALVLDATLNAVLAVALEGGAVSVVSDADTPNAVLPLETPRAIAVDDASSRALVFDSGLGAVVAIDIDGQPGEGARVVLSDESKGLSVPSTNVLYRGLAVDAANQRALVAGFSATDGWLGLYGVDLTSGDAEPLSNEEIPDDVNSWSSITGVAMGGGFAWVTDTRHLTVTRVDLATGARTASVHGRTNHDLATRFLAPDGLALDPASRRAWVVTECFGCANGVYEVSLETGERRLHASFQQPSAVAVDLQNGRILVTTTYPEATLWTVQLDSASVPLADVLSGPAIPNDHPPLVGYASDILLDPAAGRALVRDDDAVVAVSLVDGTRTAAFDDPGGCVTVDPQGRRVFSTAGNKLVSISLDDLAEDVVIDSSGASSPLNSPEAISYDVQSHRVYVLDTGDIIGIDASFGTHVPITSLDDPGTGTRWVSPTAVALDPVTQTLFVTDQLMGALYAVDAITGHRVIFTR